MARLMLVANPAASQFTGGDHRTIVRMLGRRHLVEAVWPNSASDARTIAADAVTAGFDGVVAMGGDGIVHQVAQSLVGTEVFLGVIPSGTTNVFARQLGLPAKPTKAARVLASEPRLTTEPVVTMGATTIDGETMTRHAVFALGVGVDADVVAAAETEPYRKYRFGGVHYARTAIGLLWRDVRRRPPNLAVGSGAMTGRAIAVMAQFRPTFTYFGRRPLRFRETVPDPMDLLVIRNLRMRRLPRILARVATGRELASLPGVEVWPGVGDFDIIADPPARIQVDGEMIGEVATVTAAFRPEALWVVGANRVNPGSPDADPAPPALG